MPSNTTMEPQQLKSFVEGGLTTTLADMGTIGVTQRTLPALGQSAEAAQGRPAAFASVDGQQLDAVMAALKGAVARGNDGASLAVPNPQQVHGDNKFRMMVDSQRASREAATPSPTKPAATPSHVQAASKPGKGGSGPGGL